MTTEEQKPNISELTKSSNEILTELFSTFDAEPPLIIKKEKAEDDSNKKHKKSKKKHKHKDKKHKKKDKKRKRSNSSSSEESEIDLAQILIKQEKEASEKKIKIEGTDLEFHLNLDKIKKEKDESKEEKLSESKTKSSDATDEGELPNEIEIKKEKHKKKNKHKKEKKSKRSRSRSKEKVIKPPDDLRHKLDSKEKERVRDNSKERLKDWKSRRRSDSYERELEEYKSRKIRELNSFYKEDSLNAREKDKEEKWFLKDRYRGHSERERERRCDRSRSPINRESNSYIDKKKLLEIARKNAIQMMKSGSLPGALTLGHQAQEKVIAAIKAGGKTIEELTDFCKTLSRKEELGDLSSISERSDSDSETDKPFHHPFQLKDRPTSITMNIKNSVPLPIKSTQERTSELRMQFPVSSGQHHRKTENEWIPVENLPKKSDPKPVENGKIDAEPKNKTEIIVEKQPVVPAPPNAPPGPQVFPTPLLEPTVDIGSIVSQRLAAMRRLQENPNDVQALTQMYKSNKEMQSWAQSKQQLGQFTGTTGAQILSQAELSSGYQAWAKKDQLQTAAPVSGGMGMHLLQKMGWKPGEGLGKEKTGTLEPLLLDVKLDKKGLVADEEQQRKKKQKQVKNPVNSLQGKHPVSLLGEYASKKKLGAPEYVLCFECGPDHKKNFLFKVILNGVEYKPNVASGNKKEAKATAATVCLQQIGLLPPPPIVPP